MLYWDKIRLLVFDFAHFYKALLSYKDNIIGHFNCTRPCAALKMGFLGLSLVWGVYKY